MNRDFNDYGVSDIEDVSILSNNIGKPDFDVNPDGATDIFGLTLLISFYNRRSPPAAKTL